MYFNVFSLQSLARQEVFSQTIKFIDERLCCKSLIRLWSRRIQDKVLKIVKILRWTAFKKCEQIWSVCLNRPYTFKFFKGCLPQNLLSPLLNALSHLGHCQTSLKEFFTKIINRQRPLTIFVKKTSWMFDRLPNTPLPWIDGVKHTSPNIPVFCSCLFLCLSGISNLVFVISVS